MSPYISTGVKDATADVLGRFLRNRVVTYRELAEREGLPVWRFGSEEHYEFTAPVYYNRLPDEISRLIGTHHCNPPFVMEVPDVVVEGSSGLKIANDGRYIVYNFWRTSNRDYPARSLAYDFILGLGDGRLPNIKPNRGDDIGSIDTAVSLVTKHAGNYTHWKQDCLALLEGVEHYADETGRLPKILIPADPPSFVWESLETLGYSGERIVELADERVKIHRLVLPSTRRCLSATSDDYFRMVSGLEWVRDRALDRIKSPNDGSPERILISREDTSTRRITNRRDVLDSLTNLGFEKQVLSDLSYTEQVNLFSRADLIVGAHGAGMINSIYAQNAGLIELFGRHYLPANFELANGFGNGYACLHCEAVGDDIRVEIEELRSAISALTEARGDSLVS